MILYLNNFKGFSDSFIPLESVNFLVGDNSTGKSTLLQVLEMLSQHSFWTMPQLSSGEYHLGPFNEIVNQLSSDRSFFQIGAEFNTVNIQEPGAEPILFRVLETFKEREGNIVLDSFQYLQSGNSYYCSQITTPSLRVSIRRKQYSSFVEWVHSGVPTRSRVIENKSLYFSWLPSLMRLVQETYNGNDYHHLLYPVELSNFTVISPIRAEAHRIYEHFAQSYSPQGDHIPVLLNKIMHSNDRINKTIISRLNQFGQNSKLFDGISTPRFGESSESPFSVTVEYGEVGYGVTQSLPLVVETLTSKSCVFSIQQPEVHLHPKAQAAFGDLLYESATVNNNSFFCETHSDFILNRYRYALHKGTQKVKSQVLFFTRDEKGTHVISIPIDENGHYQKVPDDFMKFFIDEELKMLEF